MNRLTYSSERLKRELLKFHGDAWYFGAVFLVVIGIVVFFQGYSYFDDAKKKHQLERENAVWLEQSIPYLKSLEAPRKPSVQSSESLLSLLNREARNHGVSIERADFQGETLIVEMREAPLEEVIVFLNSLERSQVVRLESVAITQVEAGTSRVRFSFQ